MPVAHVNDINMYYEIHGSGSPLVIIGGLGLDISEYTPITEGFAKRHQVIVFDNRGAGRTDRPNTPYTIEMMANDTAALLHQIGVTQASVLGISMGGRIALDLALHHPELVTNLVLVSTSARLSAKSRRRVRLLGLISTLPGLGGKYRQQHYAFTRQFQASSGYDRTGELGKLHIPTLIMHGRTDKIVPTELAEELHTGIKGSQLLTLDSGHLASLFKSRQPFLDATEAFLSAHKN